MSVHDASLNQQDEKCLNVPDVVCGYDWNEIRMSEGWLSACDDGGHDLSGLDGSSLACESPTASKPPFSSPL